MLQKIVDSEGTITSARFKYLQFDFFKTDDRMFIQFGKKPVKWFLVCKNDPPIFLTRTGWKVSFKFKLFKKFFAFGKTRSPIKVGGINVRTNIIRKESGFREGRESTCLASRKLVWDERT